MTTSRKRHQIGTQNLWLSSVRQLFKLYLFRLQILVEFLLIAVYIEIMSRIDVSFPENVSFELEDQVSICKVVLDGMLQAR